MKSLNMAVNVQNKKSKINKEIYGHFSEHLGRCIYEGMYVGENSDIPNTNGMRNDVVEALKEIKIPVLRWPGGCFADEYHWKDGIGEKQDRKRMINTHWGGVVEDNSFGTHEFFELCSQLECEPYICGNVGSGTVQEMAEWVEYMTFDGVSPMADLRKKNGREKPWKIKYFGVGNENWGCGGNMRPEFYADQYRRYQTYCRNFSGNELYKIACGPNVDDYNWTDKLMESLGDGFAKAISLHYYTTIGNDWNQKHSATGFGNDEFYEVMYKTQRMEQLIKNHAAIMNKYEKNNKVSLIIDEWGTWYDVEPGTNPGFLYQQNTMRDALVAAINLNLFNQNADRVVMANIAQTVNVLQAVILTEGEKMLKTPTYHVFNMFKNHQDSTLIDSYLPKQTALHNSQEFDLLSQSASVDKDGKITITLSNCSLEEDYEINVDILHYNTVSFKAQILTADKGAYNTFEQADSVKPTCYDGVKVTDNGIKVMLPKTSVVSIELA